MRGLQVMWAAVFLPALPACPSLPLPPGSAPDAVDDAIADVTDPIDDATNGLDDAAAAIEDALFAQLECEELVRPSTLERIRAVLHDPGADELRALLLNPQDLASVVALGGAQVEGPVLLARNVLRVVETGAAADLLANGWDGVSCDEPVTLACTAGEETSTVRCDGAAASSITLSFAGCTLGGTVADGALTLSRIPGDDGVAALSFEGLTFDEVQRLEGALLLDVPLEPGAGDGSLTALVASPDTLSVVEHGGLASGLSCAAETTFDRAGLSVTATDAIVEAQARHLTPDQVVGVETFGEHLRFGDRLCGCPLPGSGMLVDVPRPLGRAGEIARARVTWAAATDAGACADAKVTLEDWPSTCDGVQDVSGDCARAATEQTLERLFDALCAVP